MSQMFKEVEFKQPEKFSFTKTNLEKAKKIIAKYPEGKQQSAVMPLLDLAQRQHDNWIPTAAMIEIAKMLEMPEIKVFEVASFYTMYNKQPVGKNLIQVCRTTPCWLRGSDDLTQTCKKELGIDIGETTKDGKFTLVEVECLGACANAPMIQINDHYYEDLKSDDVKQIIADLSAGKKIKQGSYCGRHSSEPQLDNVKEQVVSTKKPPKKSSSANKSKKTATSKKAPTKQKVSKKNKS